MKTTTRRAALVATAGVAAAIGSALGGTPATAAPASPEGPATITTDVRVTLVCGERNRQVGSENGAIAYITTTCGGNPTLMTVSGWVDDTEQDGKSACVSLDWSGGAHEGTRDRNDDNLVTHFPSDWKHQGNTVRVRVWTC